jgi:hypothetical protein
MPHESSQAKQVGATGATQGEPPKRHLAEYSPKLERERTFVMLMDFANIQLYDENTKNKMSAIKKYVKIPDYVTTKELSNLYTKRKEISAEEEAA